MKLHKDKSAFKEIAGATAAALNLEEFQVEKIAMKIVPLIRINPAVKVYAN